MNVFVTGGSGFIGSHLVKALLNEGHNVTATFCNHKPEVAGIRWVKLDMEEPEHKLVNYMTDHDVVIHLVALAHQRKEVSSGRFFKINAEGVKSLASAGVKAGVKHFLFLSSIKVNGESSSINSYGEMVAFTEEDLTRPVGPYAKSKSDAEQFLKDACYKSDMDYTIIRTPVVYGPGVKANIYRLIDIVARSIPLPLARVNNKRSMIFVENLVDVLIKSITDTRALNKLYHVKDIDISTSDLIKEIETTMGKKYGLFSVPMSLLKMVCLISGRKGEFEKLTSSLSINDSKIRKELDWRPSVPFEQGLKQTVDWYLISKKIQTTDE